VRCFGYDLEDLEGIESLVETIATSFATPIDVLVYSAGASCYGEIERIPFDESKSLVHVNYLSGVRLVQQLLPEMKARQQGQIIWVGSGSAARGIPLAAVYSSSKAAARNFCEALRNEVHDMGIDVLLVVPGAMKTEFHAQQPNYSSDGRLRPIGSPREPAGLAVRVVRAGEKRKTILVYGFYAWLGHHLAYWAPAFLDRALRRG
jgi:short-subunit dehydrogenase